VEQSRAGFRGANEPNAAHFPMVAQQEWPTRHDKCHGRSNENGADPIGSSDGPRRLATSRAETNQEEGAGDALHV
jgi:hypothetical protein